MTERVRVGSSGICSRCGRDAGEHGEVGGGCNYSDSGLWESAQPLRYGYTGKAQDGPWLCWIVREFLDLLKGLPGAK